MGHNFDGTAAAALASALTLLPKWMGGKRSGNEWVGERTANGGIGNSWSVNLTTGTWGHFSGEQRGADLIALYAELNHVSMNTARLEIERQLGVNGNDVPVLPVRALVSGSHVDEPVELIPHDAPPLKEHPTYGAASAEYRYGDHFVVQRFDFLDDEGEPAKLFSQWSWYRGAWRNKGIRAPIPLYNAHRIKAQPEARVLVVEGEKCVEIAQPLFRSWVLTTWAGGVPGVKKADWSMLNGRDVIVWPDADDPGRDAGAKIIGLLAGHAASVSAVNPNGADPGWDIADAIGSGWDHPKLTSWIKEHLAPVIEAPKKAESGVVQRLEAVENGSLDLETDGSPSAALSYVAMGLDCDGNNRPYVTLANASKILQTYERFKDRIWFDEFRGQVYHAFRGSVAQPWTDRETRAVTVAIQQQLKLPKFHMDLIRHGITHAAECNSKHSLINWLDSLTWNGTERLSTWLADCAGVEINDYTTAVSRNWLIGMVARAYKPGCKMDNMPVLEGVSGLNKTQLLEVLGGEWYEAVPTEFGTKDFLQNIKGVWLAEIPDMTGFNRADHSTVISMLTVRFDKYRKAYGYESERHPRTTIFAATSETDDYVGDTRGKRRYWPIRCTDINLNTLREQRDQLFAEAVTLYQQGAHWYDMPYSALDEQSDRVTDDPWIRLISNYVEPRWDLLGKMGAPMRIHMDEVLTDGIKLLPGQQGIKEARRAGSILKALGWVKKHTGEGNHWRKVERR